MVLLHVAPLRVRMDWWVMVIKISEQDLTNKCSLESDPRYLFSFFTPLHHFILSPVNRVYNPVKVDNEDDCAALGEGIPVPKIFAL